MKKILFSFISLITLSLVSCTNNNPTPVKPDEKYEEGYEAGYNAGYKDGSEDDYDTGYDAMYIASLNDDEKKSFNEGYDNGYIEGLNASNRPTSVRPTVNIGQHTALQDNYIFDANPENISKYASGLSGHELCAPSAVTLDWSDVKLMEEAKSYKVVLADNYDFVNAIKYQTNKTTLDVYNLKTGCKYYWRIESENNTSPVYEFTTMKELVRNLYVPGTTNWRDLGGYITDDNKKIKQGLIYRSAAFNYYDGKSGTISEETKNCVLNELKVKTNVDLTGSDNITGLTKIYARMEYENIPNLIADTGNQKSIKTVFETFADSTNYPIVFHCARGRDRTGAIAFLLGALLGMSQKDLYRDYLFTNFSADNYCNIAPIKTYKTYLSSFSGFSLKEKTYSYLLDIGVTSEEITSIVDNLLI